MASATPARPYSGGDDAEWPLSASSYELAGVIGSGGFAKVHKARCVTNDRPVAVKIIKLDELQTSIEVIMNEVRVMALCRHENVLPLYAAFVDGSDLWLVTPLMSKGSAFWVLRVVNRGASADEDRPRLPEGAIKAIIKASLQGLQYLHDKKQIHRDIKAGNILIDSEGHVMIGDFGVSGWMGDGVSRSDGRRDTFVGTPCWMAPEVMEQAKGYNERADIWSLGITALELAMGTAPYATLQPMQVLIETLNNPSPSLDTYKAAGKAVPKLSADFSRFVARCLTKDAAKRPSATELLSDRFIRSSKHDDLLELLAPLGEVGPETAAALGDKPGYAAAEIKMPTKSEFAAGTTWVLWDGSGSMATESRRKVEESACTTEDMAAMLSGLGDMGMESVSDDDRGRSAATAREPDAAGASAAAAAPP